MGCLLLVVRRWIADGRMGVGGAMTNWVEIDESRLRARNYEVIAGIVGAGAGSGGSGSGGCERRMLMGMGWLGVRGCSLRRGLSGWG